MATSDEMALNGLLLEYAEAVRSSDTQRCRDTWAEDGLWVLGPNRNATGRDEIAQLWSSLRGEYQIVVQMYLATAFDITDSTATGRAQMLEFDIAAGGSRSITTGHYDDTFTRAEDGWRFKSRQWTTYLKWEI